ncbi:hypothetical protein ACFVWN_29310 [Nocardiopsis flavescens]|uniref:DUF3558 domain-containing protein n=1 Tax=Nocardiopsis flavescens TaxID=758803 RepID=A0A1M6VS60_9ACTN|nr:hypothetical protein [Nocardiopsis flavescens]SHK84342.1 hypothetical protein SAMN05421803_1372 [Nocardiopsis flavescens]
MRLIPSSPLSCLGTAAVAAVIGGFVLVGCDVVEFDEFDTDFTLFSGSGEASPSPEASADPSPGEEEEAEEETARYALPESCAEAGAAEVVGDLAPGTVLAEERGEVEGFADAEQLTCSFSDGTAGASAVTLVFTLNVDPSLSPDVVTVPGAEEEMNWEVDIDVDVDTYHTDEADSLGGDLEYVGTVDGSTRHLYLSLPGDLYVTVIAHGEEVPREDLERVVMLAAERVRG